MFHFIQGYACITKFNTKPGENTPTIERKCQKSFYHIDKYEFADMIENDVHQQPYCYTDDTAFDHGRAENDLECYCYADLCNSAANDAHLPVLRTTGIVDCKAEFCTSTGCVGIGPNGACKGEFCYMGYYNYCIPSKFRKNNLDQNFRSITFRTISWHDL